VIVFWQKKIKVIAIKIIRAEQKMPNLPKSRTFVAAKTHYFPQQTRIYFLCTEK